MQTINPFTLRNYIGPEYFCDRKIELEKLTEKFDNQRFTTLISQRRMGKTGLIYHLFYQLMTRDTDVVCLYVDLFDTQNIDDFLKKLTEEIALKVYKKSNIILKNFKNIFQSIHPLITFDTNTGIPQVEFGFKNMTERQNSIKDIFYFLNNFEKPILIAFDEFQQISSYPEINMEAILRTHIQNLRNVNFIFSGSHTHLISEMFLSSKRPFFQSTDQMYLQHIPETEYSTFIKEKMLLGKKNISDEAIQYIFDFTRIHTFYVQSMCNKLYMFKNKNIEIEDAKNVANILLDDNENSYYSYKKFIPDMQWRLLVGLAKEQGIEKLYSKNFIQSNQLNSQGTVQRALKTLLDKEMIFEVENKYFVQDVFFSRWLEKHN